MKHYDFFGNKLEVGDYVVFQCRTARRFEFAKIVRLMRDRIEIETTPRFSFQDRKIFAQEGRQLIKSTEEAYREWRD